MSGGLVPYRHGQQHIQYMQQLRYHCRRHRRADIKLAGDQFFQPRNQIFDDDIGGKSQTAQDNQQISDRRTFRHKNRGERNAKGGQQFDEAEKERHRPHLRQIEHQPLAHALQFGAIFFHILGAAVARLHQERIFVQFIIRGAAASPKGSASFKLLFQLIHVNAALSVMYAALPVLSEDPVGGVHIHRGDGRLLLRRLLRRIKNVQQRDIQPHKGYFSLDQPHIALTGGGGRPYSPFGRNGHCFHHMGNNRLIGCLFFISDMCCIFLKSQLSNPPANDRDNPRGNDMDTVFPLSLFCHLFCDH